MAQLTTGDLAVLLEVSTSSVIRWSDKLGMPHTRTVGGHRRYDEEAVRGWLREQAAS